VTILINLYSICMALSDSYCIVFLSSIILPLTSNIHFCIWCSSVIMFLQFWKQLSLYIFHNCMILVPSYAFTYRYSTAPSERERLFLDLDSKQWTQLYVSPSLSGIETHRPWYVSQHWDSMKRLTESASWTLWDATSLCPRRRLFNPNLWDPYNIQPLLTL
jgi:hypothetical protein